MEQTLAGTVDGSRFAANEWFIATHGLRWCDGVLQQAWQGSLGTIRWEKVPAVSAPHGAEKE